VLAELCEGGWNYLGFCEPVLFVFLSEEELFAAHGLRSLKIEFNFFDELAEIWS
jgi:hypothetical protein